MLLLAYYISSVLIYQSLLTWDYQSFFPKATFPGVKRATYISNP